MRHSIVCAAVCSALLLIPGCGSQSPQPVSPVVHTQVLETAREVPVPCINTMPDAPAFLTDAELLAGPGGSAVDRIWRDHVQRKQYEDGLTALLAACVAKPVK